jgi:hypothetical protein
LAGLLSAAALGQATSAAISGTVADESGGILPGVEVTVTNTDRGTTRNTISDDEGRYSVPELQLGSYQVEAALTGFQTAVRAGITLTVGRHAVVDLVLSIGEITERVVVTGEAPTVDTTSSTISGLVDENKIRDLPLNGRSFSDLVTLQMGTVVLPIGAKNSASGFGAKISVSGARPSANSFLLDGNFVNDTLNNTPAGATGLMLGVETLQEFSVLTNTYSAEYGQSMGGIINAVTKSGTNEVHGNVFYFHRNDNLDARNFFDTDSINFAERSKPPEFRRHQFGFTLGGPIVPNKTFLFGGFEGLRESLGTSTPIGTLTDELRSCVGVPAGTCPIIDASTGAPLVLAPGIEDYFIFFPRVNSPVVRTPENGIGEAIVERDTVSNEDNFVIKLDHNFSDSDSFLARYTFDESEVDNQGVNFTTFHATRNQYLTLEEKHIFSPSLLNVVRVGYNRNRIDDTDRQQFPFDESLQLVPTNRSAIPELAEGLLGTFTPPGTGGSAFGVGIIGGNTATPRIYRTNLFEYADTLTWTKGSHSLKMGANFKRVQANMVSPQRTFGSMQFASPGIFSFYNGTGGPLSFITETSEVQRGMRYWVMGFFIQDDFQATPNLTVNMGLRYEPSTEHTEVNGRIGTLKDIRTDTESVSVNSTYLNPTKSNFAPRIGLAWDPFGDGKTAVRAGFGLFYNIQMSELDRISATSNPPHTSIATISVPLPFDFETCCVGAGGAARDALELVDYLDAPQSYAMQWNLNIQRELVADTTLTVGYVGARGVDLFRVFQWNGPDPVDPSQCGPTNGPTCVNPDPGRSSFYYPAFGDRPTNSFLFGRTCPPAGGGFFRCARLNPNFDAVIQRSGGADSHYHALQLSLNKRFSRGFQIQGSYTWSNSLDTSSKQIRGPGESNQTYSTQNWLDPANEKGPSNFDVTHVFTVNYTVDLPGQNMAGAAGYALGGWQLGGIVTLATGVAETLQLGFDNCRCLSGEIFGVSTTDVRPDLVSGGDSNPVLHDGREPTEYFDRDQFIPGPAGFHGNIGRNTLRIPGVATFDFSLVKNTRLTEQTNLQFRAEFFNIFNRANFGDPSTRLFLAGPTSTAPTTPLREASAGRITSTTTTARQIQFGLKLNF